VLLSPANGTVPLSNGRKLRNIRSMPRPQASNLSSSRTAFYDLLEVGTDATEQDLKRAYRKRALRLHPDRGGDAEEFKKMKQAYDVLLDPKKRKIYDQYGEAGVKAMEGQVSPDVVMHMILNVGWWERILMVLALTILIGYLLLFPILLCVRWDHPQALRFAHVFIPIWIALAAVLGTCLFVVRAPTIDPEEDDEDMRRQVEEAQRWTCLMKSAGTAGVTILASLLLMLVLRLDGEIHWSYFIVIGPWYVLDVGLILISLWFASYWFVTMGGSPEVLENPRKWLTWEWQLHIVSLLRPHVVFLIFIFLVTLKLEGQVMSWWLVFSPVFVDWAISIIRNLFMCGSVKSKAELDAMSEEARAGEITTGSIVLKFILQALALGCVIVFCAKLAHANAFPAWWVFIPFFATGCCLCCCLSCMILLFWPDLGPEEPDPEPTAAPGAGAQAQSAPTYGSTADGAQARKPRPDPEPASAAV